MSVFGFDAPSVRTIQKTVRDVRDIRTQLNPHGQNGTAVRGALYPVKVEQVGGQAGTGLVPCDFTYDVTTIDGASVLLEEAEVIAQRPPVGKHLAATRGEVFIDTDGDLKLWRVDEVLDLRKCP